MMSSKHLLNSTTMTSWASELNVKLHYGITVKHSTPEYIWE